MKEKLKKTEPNLSECSYLVKGMHCASCEVLIEKKLIKQNNIEAVDASTSDNKVTIEYIGEKPTTEQLNRLFKSEGYSFDENEKKEEIQSDVEPLLRVENGTLTFSKRKLNSVLFVVVGVAVIFLLYKLFERFGFASAVSVTATSALPAFFLFGIVAGFSSCAALIGGIVLSMSKQWYELYSKSNSFSGKLQPHLLFNIGRVISFAILGGVLGAIGSIFTISPLFTAIVAILVSILMVLLGLQMLGIKAFQRFQFRIPKVFSRYIADESNFAGKYMPMLMGALTFFLPCGFTITAQGLAMVSGDPIRGALIMSLFALGTSPMLLFIGMSSTKMYEKAHVAENFMKLVGVLVIVFGISTVNMQFIALGLPNLSDISFRQKTINQNNDTKYSNTALPEIINGKQVVKMEASASGYTPNNIKVRVNVPVRWEINDTGTSGCTNAIIAKELFDGQIKLETGKVATKEFTPTKVGRFRFSCWMGMVTGVIEVVE
jgi:sulfite exporter TauE/SafE/copper chaperone CopZ